MSEYTKGEATIYCQDCFDCRYPGIDVGNKTIIVYGLEGESDGVRGGTKEESEANAKRIALTWNCHDELVEALENALYLLENEDKIHEYDNQFSGETMIDGKEHRYLGGTRNDVYLIEKIEKFLAKAKAKP